MHLDINLLIIVVTKDGNINDNVNNDVDINVTNCIGVVVN